MGVAILELNHVICKGHHLRQDIHIPRQFEVPVSVLHLKRA